MMFREAAAFVLKTVLGTVPPAAYLADLEALNEAAGEWAQQPEAQRLGFLEFEVPDFFGGVVQTGNLPEAISQGWTRNEAAKAFVLYIDERTGRRGTLLMLQVIILLQQAVNAGRVCIKCGVAWGPETGKLPCAKGGQCEIPAARAGKNADGAG
jgi:hypothetical protein